MGQVDCVYPLAGVAQLWSRHKSDFDLINAHGTELVLRAALKRKIKRFIHCSSAAILYPKFENPEALINEDTQPSEGDLAGPYTRSKYRAEQAAMAAFRMGLDVVVVNPTLPLGLGDRNLTPPTAMIARFLNGSTPAFLNCMVNLIDVRDVAAGMILAAERGRPGERYILGGENMYLSEFLKLLEELSGQRMPKRAIPPAVAIVTATIMEGIADWIGRRDPVATREGVYLALRSASFDNSKARRELGFAPVKIRDAVRNAVQWIQSQQMRGTASGFEENVAQPSPARTPYSAAPGISRSSQA
jgi:dihydroflavonol-4-reductase